MKSRAAEVGGVLRASSRIDARPINPSLGARERKTIGGRH